MARLLIQLESRERMRSALSIALLGLLAAAPFAAAEDAIPRDELRLAAPLTNCFELPDPPKPDPMLERMLRYSKLAVQHRLAGLASYYSGFFDGRKTANGEIFRNRKFSAAHLTLPLGCWIEVKARATGGCGSTTAAHTRRSSPSISPRPPPATSASTSPATATSTSASSRCRAKSRCQRMWIGTSWR